MKKIEQQASLIIVENKKVVCKTCLLSGPMYQLGGQPMPDCGVMCKLEPDERQVSDSHFCAQGMWILDGVVKSFKEAFQEIYGVKNNPKDLVRKEDN